MPRPKVTVPKYSKHGPSGRACVYINRRRIYLGDYGTPQSRAKYGEIIAAYVPELPATVETTPAAPTAQTVVVTINHVLLRFALSVLPKYKTSEGEPSAEQDCFLGVIRILRTLFGETAAAEFGPVKFRKVREQMIEKGWTRKYINKCCGRLRFIFRMAVSWEMVPLSVAQIIATVEPLRAGDSTAPESIPREAVPDDHIDAAKKHLRQRNRDLIDLLLLTAARPGEILALTTQIVDQTGDVWVADFKKHKNSHRGHFRTLFFGARAQLILRRYLNPLNPDARLFPIQRKTFGTAVKDACIKAGIPPFTPHWLRHTALTLIADETDMESAQRVGGHSKVATTIIYTRAAKKKARAAVEKLG